MTLAEIIHEKSRDLPEATAREVIDFIDFLKTRLIWPDEAISEDISRRAALSELANIRIHWCGKPIPDRNALYDEMRT